MFHSKFNQVYLSNGRPASSEQNTLPPNCVPDMLSVSSILQHLMRCRKHLSVTPMQFHKTKVLSSLLLRHICLITSTGSKILSKSIVSNLGKLLILKHIYLVGTSLPRNVIFFHREGCSAAYFHCRQTFSIKIIIKKSSEILITYRDNVFAKFFFIKVLKNVYQYISGQISYTTSSSFMKPKATISSNNKTSIEKYIL